VHAPDEALAAVELGAVPRHGLELVPQADGDGLGDGEEEDAAVGPARGEEGKVEEVDALRACAPPRQLLQMSRETRTVNRRRTALTRKPSWSCCKVRALEAAIRFELAPAWA